MLKDLFIIYILFCRRVKGLGYGLWIMDYALWLEGWRIGLGLVYLAVE